MSHRPAPNSIHRQSFRKFAASDLKSNGQVIHCLNADRDLALTFGLPADRSVSRPFRYYGDCSGT